MKRILTALLFLILLSVIVYSRDDAVCDSGNCINGKGTATFLTGEWYSGQWKNGKRHGKGKFVTPGDFDNIYDGDWKDDKRHGKGTYKYIPELYTGDWKNDTMNGKGVYTHFDGTKFIGEFKDGKYHGKGVLMIPVEPSEPSRGFIKYDGEFKNGVFDGKGVLIKPFEGGYIKFVGTFINGLKNEGKCYKNKKEIECTDLPFD